MVEHPTREQLLADRAALVEQGQANCERIEALQRYPISGASYRLIGRLRTIQDVLADAVWQIDEILAEGER